MTDLPQDNELQQLRGIPSVTGSQSSMPSLTKPSAAQMDTARKAAKKILGAYPDYGKAPPEYIVNFAESLSYLTAEEIAAVADPRNGVASRCQFLPTIADIHALLKERKEKADQFKPAHTNYRRLGEDKGPWDEETDYERKRRVVMECLGYNPDERGAPAAKRIFTAPTAEDMRNLKLKTPAAGPSPQLIQLLKEQEWPFIPSEPLRNKQETGEAA